MTTTRAILTPESATMEPTNFGRSTMLNTAGDQLTALAFDAATSQAVMWTVAAPDNFTSPWTLVIKQLMASATSGAVVWRAYVEAVTAGDSAPTPASASSFDSANSSGAITVAGTLIETDVTITLTNGDSTAAGDRVRIKVDRDAANGSDTAAGDAYILECILKDAA